MERCEHEDEMRDIVRRVEGLYVGMLSPVELQAFEYLIDKQAARRSYAGLGGFMGMAKVELITTP